MTTARDLEMTIAALRCGSATLDVDIIALEALQMGLVPKPPEHAQRDAGSYDVLMREADAQSFDNGLKVPIIDARKLERVVYCVALQPYVPDTYGSIMMPESIAYTAHRYIMSTRTIKVEHVNEIRAYPVESFIAPQDLTYGDAGSMYGAQVVTKDSWVVGIKVFDDAVWKGIVDGVYTGVSVSGFSMSGDLPQ